MSRTRSAVLVMMLLVGGVAAVPAGVAAQDGQTTVNCTYPITVTDATGTAVTVEEEPQRVTVIGPSTAQTMWEIGAQDKVVGMPVNQFTGYLEGSDSKTHVVNQRGQPVREAVVGTEPDLVLVPNITSRDAVDGLRAAGLTVFVFGEATSLADVSAKTRLTGRLVGEFGTATQVSAETTAAVETVRAAVEGTDRPTAYYPLGGGYTAGPETFIGDVIDSAGADNVASEAGIAGYDIISQEVLASATIDWLVLPGQSPRPMNIAINNSRAVAQDQIVRPDANLLGQPAPRIVGPLTTLAEAFHPEAMAGVDVGSVEAEPSVRCAAAVESDDATTTTSGDGGNQMMADQPTAATTTAADGPGFTVALAALAMLALSLAATRRD